VLGNRVRQQQRVGREAQRRDIQQDRQHRWQERVRVVGQGLAAPPPNAAAVSATAAVVVVIVRRRGHGRPTATATATDAGGRGLRHVRFVVQGLAEHAGGVRRRRPDVPERPDAQQQPVRVVQHTGGPGLGLPAQLGPVQQRNAADHASTVAVVVPVRRPRSPAAPSPSSRRRSVGGRLRGDENGRRYFVVVPTVVKVSGRVRLTTITTTRRVIDNNIIRKYNIASHPASVNGASLIYYYSPSPRAVAIIIIIIFMYFNFCLFRITFFLYTYIFVYS